jgi:hypothetical protein
MCLDFEGFFPLFVLHVAGKALFLYILDSLIIEEGLSPLHKIE